MSTHDVAVSGNGTVPGASDGPLAGIVAELEDLLAPMEAERAQLLARLNDLDVERLRIAEGIAALTGSRPKPAAKRSPDARNSHDWVPSQKTLDDVYAFLVNASEPLGVTAIADGIKTSRGTAKKAVDELRKQERVRFCGKGGTGAANLFAPMSTSG